MPPKRRSDRTLIFPDYPEFRPNTTPAEAFQKGIFGGTYFRPIASRPCRRGNDAPGCPGSQSPGNALKSSLSGRQLSNQHKEFPASWFRGLDIAKTVTSPTCDKTVNKYGVTSGTSLDYWEQKGWIHPQDPYGWFQWYCRFYQGRRTADDRRQIDRWLGVAGDGSGRLPDGTAPGPGRFRSRLAGMIAAANKKDGKRHYKDRSISPVIRQLLLQWGVDTG